MIQTKKLVLYQRTKSRRLYPSKSIIMLTFHRIYQN